MKTNIINGFRRAFFHEDVNFFKVNITKQEVSKLKFPDMCQKSHEYNKVCSSIRTSFCMNNIPHSISWMSDNIKGIFSNCEITFS